MAEKKAFIQSVDRALQILECFYTSSSLSLAEITERIGLAKTTVFGLIATLEKRGFLKQDPKTGLYHTGIRFIQLAAITAERSSLIDEAVRLLKPIASLHGHTAHITSLELCDVIYVGHVVADNATITIKTNIGSRAPAYCTSSGKAFLSKLPPDEQRALLCSRELSPLTPNSIIHKDALFSHLEMVKNMGYAVDNEESILGVKGVGMVVCNRADRPVIGISIAGLASQFTEEMISDYVPRLNDVCSALLPFADVESI